MKKRTITNQSNFAGAKGEVNTESSVTIPDQSMTVAEMVQRYNSGLPMRGQRVPIFNGDEPLPDITNMDLADAQAVTEAIADQLADVKARIDVAKTTAQKRQELERIEEQVKIRLKAIQDEQKANPNTQ